MTREYNETFIAQDNRKKMTYDESLKRSKRTKAKPKLYDDAGMKQGDKYTFNSESRLSGEDGAHSTHHLDRLHSDTNEFRLVNIVYIIIIFL